MPERAEKIAAVVVTYNRKDLLCACLEALLAQSHPLDALYIIDNYSTDGTYDALLGQGLLTPIAGLVAEPAETVRQVVPAQPAGRAVEVHYVRLPENTGGAGGFHEGLQRAAAAGFDWLWLMDDDVRAAPEALQALVQQKAALAAASDRPFILNSLVLAQDPADNEALAFPLQELSARGRLRTGVYHWRLSEVRDRVRDGLYPWICPFNGTFLPARAVAEVGLPNKEFFLWGDEMDYFWRARKKFDLYTVIESRVFHPRPRAGAFDWKQYYLIRNMFVINRHLPFTTLRHLRLMVRGLARGLRHGRPGLALMLRAIRDGLTGRLGKRYDIHP